jgi:hypothetical protein
VGETMRVPNASRFNSTPRDAEVAAGRVESTLTCGAAGGGAERARCGGNAECPVLSCPVLNLSVNVPALLCASKSNPVRWVRQRLVLEVR